jgi:capsular exopolysaccharide synthesis family protein
MTDPPIDFHFRVVTRNVPLILTAGVIAAIVAFGVSLSEPSKFRATSKILVSASDQTAVSANEDPARIVDTLVKLAKSGEILAFSATRAGVSRETLNSAVSVSGSPTADVISVSATARTAERAARLANALSTGFVDWRETRAKDQARARIAFLERQLAKLRGQSSPSAIATASDIRTQLSQALAELQVPSSDLIIISQAKPPSARFAPNPVRNAILALIAGCLLGIAGAAVRERMDNRIHADEDLEKLYGAPVLGDIPDVPAARRGDRLAALADLSKETPLADAFRSIRTNLRLFRRIEATAQVLLVTSAVAGEGKTTVTANLARAFAVSGQRVLAISADVHSPMLHLLLLAESWNQTPYGVIEVLADELPLEKSTRRHIVVGPGGQMAAVAVLGNARKFPDPSILYQSHAMDKMLARARESFDVVLIDSPPLLANAESALLASRADGLILVSRIETLTRQQAHQANRILSASDLKPLGVIVTGKRGGLGYGYGYGYGNERVDWADQSVPDPRAGRTRQQKRVTGTSTPAQERETFGA